MSQQAQTTCSYGGGHRLSFGSSSDFVVCCEVAPVDAQILSNGLSAEGIIIIIIIIVIIVINIIFLVWI